MDRMQLSKHGLLAVDQSMFRVPLKKLKKLFILSQKYYEYALTQVRNELQNMKTFELSDSINAGDKSKKVESLNKILLLIDNLKKKVLKYYNRSSLHR